MLKKATIGAVLLLLVLIVVACAGPTPAPSSAAPAPKPSTTQTPGSAQTTVPPPAAVPAAKPSGPIKATVLTPTVANDTVSIPASVVQNKWNTYFLVNAGGSPMGFMAYVLNNNLFVRGSACPPCRGKTYTLDGNILVCDMCGTTFEAKTGVGISGACVNYPKTSVPYNLNGGDVVMKITDLQTAFQNTLKAGLP